jgi:hypothetical protein
MRPAVLTAAVCLLAIPVAGCDTGSEESSGGGEATEAEVPGGADPASVAVIDEWATTLAAGDVDGAAELFALPSVAENGGTAVQITELGEARLFNASLPCGARLERAETEGEFTIATFRLVERPGPGTCGAGTGETAQTAFVIEDGAITEWRRVVPTDDPEPSGTPA